MQFEDTTTNNATWKRQFQFNDSDTGDLIDFTGASITIQVREESHCMKIEASTGNGMVTIDSLGVFEMSVPASTMSNLRPDTYLLGGVYTIGGDTFSLFTGTLSVTDGISRT